MSPLTCDEVEAQIDLYAAGEGDAAERAAIQMHLTRCPACTRTYREAQQLAGLLDLHFQEPERLRRLHARLDGPERRVLRLPRVPAAPRRAAALAALILLTVGFQFLAPPARQTGGESFAVSAGPRALPGGPDAKEMFIAAAVRGNGQEQTRGPQPLGATLLWASPDADWHAVGERQVELQGGELWWNVASPTVEPGRPLPPFEVTTPAGTVKAREAQFAVAVRPVPRVEAEGMPQTAITVKAYAGVVEVKVRQAGRAAADDTGRE
jgi:ferric-dicitrate binding protein FerR (iron transport regulator)